MNCLNSSPMIKLVINSDQNSYYVNDEYVCFQTENNILLMCIPPYITELDCNRPNQSQHMVTQLYCCVIA